MMLTRAGTASKACTDVSDTTSGGPLTINPAANVEMGTGAGNQILTTLVIVQHQPIGLGTASAVSGGRHKHFLSLNRHKFYGSHTEDSLWYFIDENFKDLKTMSTHGYKVVEFVTYQLKNETHA
ncbi:hypothetical protein HAX54_041363 [Datura stramonium]|uniref:USP domain-containing protein n=1 Tax=Datura stramonium TaxID=4076 RepID=A0ABS8VSJ5_DATST|nr:hypothetical protein [Datura stramonium]